MLVCQRHPHLTNKFKDKLALRFLGIVTDDWKLKFITYRPNIDVVSGTLKLKNATADYSGDYACTARNRVDSSQCVVRKPSHWLIVPKLFPEVAVWGTRKKRHALLSHLSYPGVVSGPFHEVKTFIKPTNAHKL
eukprot:g24813.t1